MGAAVQFFCEVADGEVGGINSNEADKQLPEVVADDSHNLKLIG